MLRSYLYIIHTKSRLYCVVGCGAPHVQPFAGSNLVTHIYRSNSRPRSSHYEPSQTTRPTKQRLKLIADQPRHNQSRSLAGCPVGLPVITHPAQSQPLPCHLLGSLDFPPSPPSIAATISFISPLGNLHGMQGLALVSHRTRSTACRATLLLLRRDTYLVSF